MFRKKISVLVSPDTRAASDWLLAQASRHAAQRAEQWILSRSHWSSEWVEAADSSDLQLSLRPDRLRRLHDDLLAVVWSYLDAQDDPDDADVRECVVQLQTFPLPEPDAER